MNVYNCIMLFYALQTIFAVYLQTKTMCKGRASILLRLLGNYSQMSLGRPSCPPGFPPNFSIFETHVHIVCNWNTSKHHHSSLCETLLHFLPILLLGFLTETNTEHPMQYLGLSEGIWCLDCDTLSRSLSLCFAYWCPRPSVTPAVTPHSVTAV